jgi:hypothetical protein
MASSLKLVGDRHGLTARQRLAVSRAACSDQSRERRRRHLVPVETVEGGKVIIDGFNLIITVEAALSGGLLLLCRDNCIRDLSSVHGSYRSIEETEPAIHLVGEVLTSLEPSAVVWLLDRPISNSGRLALKIREIASERAWPWRVEIVFNPDSMITSSASNAITSDSFVLDKVQRWVNFNSFLLTYYLPHAWLLDLRES